MIETILYFALGFLSAALVALIVMPAVWRRAVRLTRRQIELTTPLTRAEIRADRDQLAAEFAVSSRKLEIGLATARRKTADMMAALTRSRDEVKSVARERELAWAEVQRLNGQIEEYKSIVSGDDPRPARIEELEAENARLRLERNMARDELRDLEAATGAVSRERSMLADEQARTSDRIRTLSDMVRAREQEIAGATQIAADARHERDQMAARLEAGARDLAMIRQERDYLREQFAALQAREHSAATGSATATDNLVKTIDALSQERDALRAELSALATRQAEIESELAQERDTASRSAGATVADFDDLRRTLVDLGSRIAAQSSSPVISSGTGPAAGDPAKGEEARGEAAAEGSEIVQTTARKRRSSSRKASPAPAIEDETLATPAVGE